MSERSRPLKYIFTGVLLLSASHLFSQRAAQEKVLETKKPREAEHPGNQIFEDTLIKQRGEFSDSIPGTTPYEAAVKNGWLELATTLDTAIFNNLPGNGSGASLLDTVITIDDMTIELVFATLDDQSGIIDRPQIKIFNRKGEELTIDKLPSGKRKKIEEFLAYFVHAQEPEQ